MSTTVSETKRSDFIRDIVAQHLKEGRYATVVTRFPPEPNGFLHIGHAKSICLNFGIARDFGGRCHLRMDDTDPTKEDVSYVQSIMNDVRWLGFDWGEHMYYASDYFQKFYELAVKLIEDGNAYVDSLNEQEIREYRGTVTEPGRPSPYRDRSVAENLDLFTRMKNGDFPDGAHVLRGKIDMANPNMKMRDPLLYRIRHAHHYRTGDAWCIYPMYDFAHPISDALEGITHSICTLEFENNRELYDWVLDVCGFAEPRPHQYEFARLNLNYSVMSKRKFLQLVDEKHVAGWDDPRMPTISGLRRRGVTPEALRRFCDAIGVAKANSTVDMAQLEHAIRDDLNPKVPRVLAVLRPLKVVIENYPEGRTETLDAPLYPHDVPLQGSRPLPFGREIYIERDDFTENPPKGYKRLSPGEAVRLRHAYVIECREVVKDAAGHITELRCTYDPQTRSGDSNALERPDARKPKGTIHWVPAHESVTVEARLYDRLFDREAPEGVEHLNPHNLEILTDARVEPWVAQAEPDSRFQFERQGYFYLEPESSRPGHPVFNRIVGLKDSWSKAQLTEAPCMPTVKPEPVPAQEKAKAASPAVALSPQQEARLNRYRQEFALGEDEARVIATADAVAHFFEAAIQGHANARAIGVALVNDLLPALKDRPLADAPVTPDALAELVALVETRVITSKVAKDVVGEMVRHGGTPRAIVEAKGWKQIADPSELSPLVDQVIAANPDNASKYREGKTSLLGFFVGQVIKQTGGRANPEVVTRLVQQKLS